MRFSWDPLKNTENTRKHGISFEQAELIFRDDLGILIPDPDHSFGEERLILIGAAAELGICVVCHCHLETNDVIRMISARPASKKEKIQYRRQYES
jgi:uncharacterized protein